MITLSKDIIRNVYILLNNLNVIVYLKNKTKFKKISGNYYFLEMFISKIL